MVSRLRMFYSVLCVVRVILPFPTRRSSDLADQRAGRVREISRRSVRGDVGAVRPHGRRSKRGTQPRRDGKSTRLNSSHMSISYAVFCLTKKKEQNPPPRDGRIHVAHLCAEG